MQRILLSVILACAAFGFSFPLHAQEAPAAQPVKAAQADVPVKVVVLFSSGVGYFEHFGLVQGNASTELRFKTAQINDILKSLVLQDVDGGQVTTVTYPSQDPLDKTLKSFQIDISGNPALGDLLNQLRGASVTVQAQGEQLTGTILGVETQERQIGEKPQIIKSYILNLLAGGTLRAIELNQIRDIQLQDPQLRDELHRALTALAQARDQDKKPVTIQFTGQGQRRVRLGYVVEAPVWKTSYRLILPANAKDKPNLQGWAIVENQTDNDWTNVQLSLVSGRPISFIQDLYKPLYIARPVVQPELYASLVPQMYERGLETETKMDRSRPMFSAGRARAAKESGRIVNGALGGEMAGLPSTPPMDAEASIVSVASAAKVGELFQYTVGNVSLPRQRSAMIPIITDPIEVERLSIYNASVLPRNPLNGAMVKNTTGKHLLQGPLTVLDANTYAGDARIDNVPPGQQRLLSYGVDLQMLVDATKNRSDSAITSGRIVKGILYITNKNIFTQDYQAENKSEKDKTLVIEHPIRQGWKLVSEEKPFETTDALYRFKEQVPAGKIAKLTVREELVQDETIAILPADFGQIEFYSRTGQIPANVRDALAKAAALKRAMVDTQRQIEERQNKIQTITAEQLRIRDNMRVIDRNTDYYTRLLKKLNSQESDLEKNRVEIDDLNTRLQAQRQELENYLGNLNVGG